MPPASSEGSMQNVRLIVQLSLWSDRDGTGEAFDSRGGYVLPNGATLSPDASWVRRSRLDALPPEQEKRFLPLAPDFAAELASPTDSLSALQRKMEEYISNGVQLGILVQPKRRPVFVYRPGAEPVTLEDPQSVSCSPELPGLVFDIGAIFRTVL
jgi:Uma2 family endonuclease